jgi:uncharacterized protein YdaT
MPWKTPREFKMKHWQDATIPQAREAKKVAESLLGKGEDEGKAISIGIATAKKKVK